jgi:hypothetical protein
VQADQASFELPRAVLSQKVQDSYNAGLFFAISENRPNLSAELVRSGADLTSVIAQISKSIYQPNNALREAVSALGIGAFLWLDAQTSRNVAVAVAGALGVDTNLYLPTETELDVAVAVAAALGVRRDLFLTAGTSKDVAVAVAGALRANTTLVLGPSTLADIALSVASALRSDVTLILQRPSRKLECDVVVARKARAEADQKSLPPLHSGSASDRDSKQEAEDQSSARALPGTGLLGKRSGGSGPSEGSAEEEPELKRQAVGQRP